MLHILHCCCIFHLIKPPSMLVKWKSPLLAFSLQPRQIIPNYCFGCNDYRSQTLKSIQARRLQFQLEIFDISKLTLIKIFQFYSAITPTLNQFLVRGHAQITKDFLSKFFDYYEMFFKLKFYGILKLKMFSLKNVCFYKFLLMFEEKV